MTGIYFFDSAELAEVPTDNLISVDVVAHLTLDAAISKHGWPKGTRVRSEEGRTFRVEGFCNGKQLVRDLNVEENYELEIASLTPISAPAPAARISASSLCAPQNSASAPASMFSSSSTVFQPPTR